MKQKVVIKVQCYRCGQWHRLAKLRIFHLGLDDAEFWQCGGCLASNNLAESKRWTYVKYYPERHT